MSLMLSDARTAVLRGLDSKWVVDHCTEIKRLYVNLVASERSRISEKIWLTDCLSALISIMRFILIVFLLGCSTPRYHLIPDNDWMIDELREGITPESVPDERLREKINNTLDKVQKENHQIREIIQPMPVAWYQRWEFRLSILLACAGAVLVIIKINF